MPAIDKWLEELCLLEGSDLHIATGKAPMIRVDGEVKPLPKAEPKECAA